ncbi:hypothetical protein BGW39_005544 [Mortierella sp. 14UC]|nr:hypothetical protein BGW39_005544 [Mortierella sp. 14UC]
MYTSWISPKARIVAAARGTRKECLEYIVRMSLKERQQNAEYCFAPQCHRQARSVDAATTAARIVEIEEELMDKIHNATMRRSAPNII